MHGSILMSLERHVATVLGPAGWDRVRAEAGTPGRLFTSLGVYDDGDVIALVGAVSTVSGLPVADVLRGFGRALVPDLLRTYGALVSQEWTAFDLLEHTEATIHHVVRARQPGAQPPTLQVERRTSEHVSIRYASERRLCALAHGIVLGVGDHFATPLQVSETSCMHKGAPACQLEVLPTWSAPKPRQAADSALQV